MKSKLHILNFTSVPLLRAKFFSDLVHEDQEIKNKRNYIFQQQFFQDVKQ